MKIAHSCIALSLLLVSWANAECIRPKVENYTKVACLQEGLSVVTRDHKYGVIDVNGKEIIPLQYEFIGSLGGGLYPAKKDGKRGYINKQGKQIIPFEYDFAGTFEDGIAKVNQNGDWFYINRIGEVVKKAEE
ncbi:MAG: WG repeat-containing protein [Neisseriaceae bacterium]|nr:WG repeat-containing protein [Neisseriaceae bacterium]